MVDGSDSPIESNKEKKVDKPELKPSVKIFTRKEELESKKMQISFLENFYGITGKAAQKLVQDNYDGIFEVAAKSGVSLEFLKEIFLQYIPQLKNENKNIEGLAEKRILELLIALKKGIIKENNFKKLLLILIKKPNITVDILISEFETKEAKDVIDSLLTKDKQYIIEEKHDISTEKVDKIFTLIDIPTLQYSLSNVGGNCHISFYKSNNFLCEATVSFKIRKTELNYLLIYETGLLKEYKKVALIEKIAKEIHDSIIYLSEEIELPIDIEERLETLPEQQYLEETKTDIDSYYFPFIEEHNIYFMIKKDEDRNNITFFSNSELIGEIEFSYIPNLAILVEVIKSQVKIPSDLFEYIDTNSKFILSILNLIIKDEIPGKILMKTIEDKKSTSTLLRAYLELVNHEED